MCARPPILLLLPLAALVVLVDGCATARPPSKWEIDEKTQRIMDEMLTDMPKFMRATSSDDPEITEASMTDVDKLDQEWRRTEFHYEYRLSELAYAHHLLEQEFGRNSADPRISNTVLNAQVDQINELRVEMGDIDVQKGRDHKRERATKNSLMFEYSFRDGVCEFHNTQLVSTYIPVVYTERPRDKEGYKKARLLTFRNSSEPFYTKAKLETWAPRKIKVPVCAACSTARRTFFGK